MLADHSHFFPESHVGQAFSSRFLTDEETEVLEFLRLVSKWESFDLNPKHKLLPLHYYQSQMFQI